MTSATAEPPDEALEAARWDLQPLVNGEGADGALRLVEEAKALAGGFAESRRGSLADMGASALATAMRELEEIYDRLGRAGSYASLAYSVDTQDPERGALLQKLREGGAEIETSLLFFDLEWNLLPDDRVEQLLGSGELEFCAHHLRTLRRYRPHQLSEPEERVLTEADVTGRSAFARLFTEQTSAVTVDLPDAGDPVPLMEALSRPCGTPTAACTGERPGARDQGPHPGRAFGPGR